tara:strand:- start:542 stop:787 length:246 start_codon:yes stop_codon:yes gene_type:complete
MINLLFIHYIKKKEGRQLDFASCPSAATIFSFIYYQGINSLSILDSVFGVSLYAPNVAEPIMARVAKIAIMILCIVLNYLD